MVQLKIRIKCFIDQLCVVLLIVNCTKCGISKKSISEAQLKVHPFIFPPALSIGSQLRQLCAATQNSELLWYKDHNVLRRNGVHNSDNVTSHFIWEGIRVTEIDNAVLLTIANVQPSHSGNYTCAARNSKGSSSFSAFLTVVSSPQWIKIPPPRVVISPRNSQKLVCEADGYPKPDVSWTTSKGVTIIYCSNLNVQFKVPPKFEEKHTVVSARRGENVKLTCEAQGDTPLHIKWSKGNRIIDKKPNNRYEIYETFAEQSIRSELFITTTERTDGAIYTCLAQNEHGTDDRSVKLLIIEVPQPPRDVKVSETWSRSASISWTAPYAGNSPITRYTVQYWRVAQSHRLEELEVVGTQTSVLLSDLRPGIAYQVAVVADNAVGSSQLSSTVTFTTGEEEPSEVPTDFHVEAKGPHTIRVSWKPPPRDEWNGQLKGYYIGYKPSGQGQPHSFKTAEYKENSTNEFFLTGLQKATEYSVVVKAFNGAGVGRQTPDLHVKTLEGDLPPSPRVRSNE
ncbi:neogenin-like [Tropilaelaps mercedesae]|uniref:Neogenin-like n=1 Tax=Tropilaelaps mercedesae TaxID=418985 RepID=A0A1V9XTA1_9ACAR|nr:neogenin-like [Tropilaelaps mercedesae]